MFRTKLTNPEFQPTPSDVIHCSGMARLFKLNRQCLRVILLVSLLVALLPVPHAKGGEEVLLEDEFLDAPNNAMAAALSHIFLGDPVFGRTSQIWESTGGSSNGFPFWVVKEDDTGYLFENPHIADWTNYYDYYYSGIMSQRAIRLEPGYAYVIEIESSVDEWYSLSEGGANTNKLQTDLDPSLPPMLSLYASFNFFGGTNVIRISQNGQTWQVLEADGWEEPLDLGVGFFKETFLIEVSDDSIHFEFFLFRADGSLFKYLSTRTRDRRALAFLGTPLKLVIQVAQDKGPYAPERNFKLRRVYMARYDL